MGENDVYCFIENTVYLITCFGIFVLFKLLQNYKQIHDFLVKKIFSKLSLQ